MAASASGVYEKAKARLKKRLVDLLDGAPENEQAGVKRQALVEDLRQALQALPEEYRALKLTGDDENCLIHEVIDDILGYGPLDLLLADGSISEIMVNGPDEIFIERNGKLTRVEGCFRDAQHLRAIVERMLGKVGLTVNESEPLCDASLPDGCRINVIIPPLVLNGPVVTIRKKLREWTMQQFLEIGTISDQAAEFLQACVRAKVNLVVSGGTSTGKTTLVGILSASIAADERIITIENSPELELSNRDHWVRLIAKAPNLEGRGEIPLRTLVKNALRMRPDRIILGEARGGEALDVVQAMHSGHDGFMTVLHANDARAALERLEMLMLMSGLDLPPSACRVQIASAVDLVVHMGRFSDGSRRVAAISQVMGTSQEGFELDELFRFEVQGFSPEGKLQGGCQYTGTRPSFLSKFQLNKVKVAPWLNA